MGGAGSDVFAYLNASDSNSAGWDRIIDFTQGKDKIDLSELLGKTTELAWGDKTGGKHTAWYQNFGSSTVVFADVNGDGKADLQIELKNTSGLKLKVSDFIGVSEGNSSPVITSGPQAASVTELADSVENAFTHEDGHTIGFTDADTLDTHTASFVAQGTGYLGSFSLGPVNQSSDSVDWHFSVADAALDFLAAGQVLTQKYDVKVDDGHGGTAVQTVELTLTGVNDAAMITGNAKGQVTEDGPQLDHSGNLNVKDVDTGEAAFQTPASLAGQYGTFTFDSETGAWKYTLDNDALNVQALNGKTTVQDSLTVTSLDGTASETIMVDIAGTNDEATITDSGAEDSAVKEAGGVANGTTNDPSASGQLTVDDVDSGEEHFQAPGSLTGDYGTFTFDTTSGAWGYTLDDSHNSAADKLTDGQVVHDKLTVNSFDTTASHTIDVAITGTNDEATIVVPGAEDTAVTEAGGVANATKNDPSAGGQLTVNDVDSGEDHFLTPDSLAGTYGEFTFDANNGKWTYTLDQSMADSLAENHSATDALTVKSLDGTAFQTITVNVTGANDAPVAMPDANPSDAELSGNLLANDTDPDTGETSTLTVTKVAFNGISSDFGDAVFSEYGILVTDAQINGGWGYQLNAKGIQALANGDDVDEVFNYTMEDGHEATASSTLTIHIAGTGAAPVVVAAASSAAAVTVTDTPDTVGGGNNAPVAVADEANAGIAGTSGNVLGNDMDLDTGDSLFVTEVNGNPVEGDLSFGSYGYLLMTDAGDWGYQLNNAGIDALAQGASVDDVFGYTIADAGGATASSTLTIHITDAADFIL